MVRRCCWTWKKLRLRVVQQADRRPGNRGSWSGGRLSDPQGWSTCPTSCADPALTVKDRERPGISRSHIGANYIGLSFVAGARRIHRGQTLIDGRAWVMAKLEKPQALDKSARNPGADGCSHGFARGTLASKLP